MTEKSFPFLTTDSNYLILKVSKTLLCYFLEIRVFLKRYEIRISYFQEYEIRILKITIFVYKIRYSIVLKIPFKIFYQLSLKNILLGEWSR